MRTRCTLVAILLATSGCGDGGIVQIGTAEGVVMSDDKASQLLQPCSRERPARPDGYWVPGVEDLRMLEQELPRFLKSNPSQAQAATINNLAASKRQYLGVLRGDRRSIYVNVFPYHPVATADWATEPVIVCDGGASFFGAEFDVVSRHFTHVAYNGAG